MVNIWQSCVGFAYSRDATTVTEDIEWDCDKTAELVLNFGKILEDNTCHFRDHYTPILYNSDSTPYTSSPMPTFE